MGNPPQVIDSYNVPRYLIANSPFLESKNSAQPPLSGYWEDNLAIFALFSKRQKKLRGEMPDVHIYDMIPKPLRVQIVYIWDDALGNSSDYENRTNVYQMYKMIVNVLCREHSLFRLWEKSKYDHRNYYLELIKFFLEENDTEFVLDAIELSFVMVDSETRKSNYLNRYDSSQRADEAIEELNNRFREHGVGYQYIDGQIIRVDSEVIHTDVVKPALALLHSEEFAGPQEEFLKAHKHYRHGNSKEALTECLKAFESVMKVICAKRKWKHSPQATSSALIKVCFDNGLIPSFWESHFSALRSLLEGGVPTARNRLGGHGQGATVVEVPGYIVSYVLHMTAASIVFLVEADQHLK